MHFLWLRILTEIDICKQAAHCSFHMIYMYKYNRIFSFHFDALTQQNTERFINDIRTKSLELKVRVHVQYNI